MPAVLEARPPSVAAQPADAAEAPDRAAELAADVAKAVRDLRAGAGLSERAAARLLGTSQTQLRRMEDPRYLPSLRSLARVAAAYGHRLRIAFEPHEGRPVKAARPARPRPVAPPRPKRSATARPSRPGRSRRRA